MLNEIRLQNFKIFKELTRFAVSKINLLTGINGRGKSTLLQSLLLMRQSIEYSENTSRLLISGNCVRLGTYGDIKNKETVQNSSVNISFSATHVFIDNKIPIDTIEYTASYELLENNIDNTTLDIKLLKLDFNKPFKFAPEGKNEYTGIEIERDGYDSYKVVCSNGEEISKYNNGVSVSVIYKNLIPIIGMLDFNGKLFNSEFLFRFSNIHYIPADRIGPKDYYKKYTMGKFLNTGIRGEGIGGVLLNIKGPVIEPLLEPENRQKYRDKPESIDKSLLGQCGIWLSKILDTEGIRIFVYGDSPVIELYFSFGNDEKKYKPINVGFGYSYVLPIIISGLIARPGEILIVENPEAHLHPKGQSELTKFLAKVAQTGVQVFIESHSEHILNGLRVCALNSEMDISNSDISIMYFNEKSIPQRLSIEADGKIVNWPDGFFDQQEIDLANIFKFSR